MTCQNCANLQQEIDRLQNEVYRLQARIDAAGRYCQENVSRANAMLETNLGMRTFGRMSATVEHLSHVAGILGIVAEPSPKAAPWRGFRRFLR